jgi:hypothetical protein
MVARVKKSVAPRPPNTVCAEPPSAPPLTLDQKRIAHNIAIAAGDGARASALLAEIERELTPVRASFDDGSELVGVRYREGARSLLLILVRAAGPSEGDVQLTVRSRVTARAPWSLTIADPTEREVGIPLAIAPMRWKKGFLYADPVPIRKRPGTEVFRAVYWARGKARVPRPKSGDAAGVPVLTLR